MSKDNGMCPGFDLNYVYKLFSKAKENDLIKRYVDNLVIFFDRIERNENQVLVYVGNHQSVLDYFLPHYAILDIGLPYPRTIAGRNLDDFPFRQMLGLRKKGMIWIDKHKINNFRYKREFITVVKGLLIRGKHILVYAEGGRNYDVDGEVKEFKRGVFDASLDAQLELDSINGDREVFILPFAVCYENMPEREFFSRMGIAKEKMDYLAYYGWDIYSYLRWRYFEKNRGTARINFGDKIPIKGLVSVDDLRRGRKSLAEFIRQEVIRLKKEIS